MIALEMVILWGFLNRYISNILQQIEDYGLA